MRLTGRHAAMLFVEDFQKMFSFYRDGMGPLGLDHAGVSTPGWLPPGDDPYIIDTNWCMFFMGDDLNDPLFVLELFDAAVFAQQHPKLLQNSKPPMPRANGLIVGHIVEGLEECKAHLESFGADFPDGVTQEAWGRIAHFHDPEGNRFELCEIDE